MQNPENLSSCPKILEKTKILDLISTFTFFLFALGCSFSISLTQIAGFTGLGILLIRTQLTRSWAQFNTVLLVPFSGLYLAGVLSTLLGVDPMHSLPVLRKLVGFVVFIWVVNGSQYINLRHFQPIVQRLLNFRKRNRFLSSLFTSSESLPTIQLVINTLIVSTAVSALYGLLQGASHGLSISSRTEIHSTFSHVFTFSAVLMMVNLMVLAYLLFGTKKRAWPWISFFIISLCLIFTFNRMTWVGFFMGAIVLFFFKKKTLVILPLLVLAMALLIGPESVSDRLSSIVDLDRGTTPIRLAMWKAGLDVIKDHPWTGCGYNCLYLIYDQYPQHPILQKWFFNLHSNWVQITVDLGLLGLGTWITLWISYFVVLLRRYRNSSSASSWRWVTLGSGAVVISFLTAGTFETNFYDSEVVMVLYFIMALPFVNSNNAKSAPSSS
jgi:O-antigen ligase